MSASNDQVVDVVAKTIHDRHNEGTEWETIIEEYRDYYRTTARLIIAEVNP